MTQFLRMFIVSNPLAQRMLKNQCKCIILTAMSRSLLLADGFCKQYVRKHFTPYFWEF